eukprot:scaffold305676_cov37-Tisochrysis_lutea.AAC.2
MGLSAPTMYAQNTAQVGEPSRGWEAVVHYRDVIWAWRSTTPACLSEQTGSPGWMEFVDLKE